MAAPIAVALGCASESPSSASATSGGIAAGGGGAAPSTSMVTVLVIAPERGTFPGDPLAGASVHAELPGRGPVDAVTGPDGRVTFNGVDWSKGTASIAAFLDDSRVIYSASDFGPNEPWLMGPETGDVFRCPLGLRNSAVATDLLTLGFTDVINPAADVTIWADRSPRGAATTVALGYATLDLLPKAPFTLTTWEATPQATLSPREVSLVTQRWAAFDEPKPTNPEPLINIDIASGGSSLSEATAQAEIVIPGGNDGPFGSQSRPVVLAFHMTESGALSLPFGIKQAALTSGNTRFELTLAYPAGGMQPDDFIQQYCLQAGTGEVSCNELVQRPSAETVQVVDLLPPPILAQASIHLGQPVPVEVTGASSQVRLVVYDGAETVWLNDAPPGTKAMHVASLPTRARFVRGGVKYALLVSLADLDSTVRIYTKLAQSRVVTVAAAGAP